MAWLGVNLNESLSNIKGQISSFTREVLAEDEIGDKGEDIVIPKKHVKELESTVYFHKQEIEELKKSRMEMEDRLRGAELSSLQIVSALKKQLSDAQEELQQLKAKSTDWDWENGSSRITTELNGADTLENNISPNHVARIASLEEQLRQDRLKHEDEIVALREVHRAEIVRIETELAGSDSKINGENENSPLFSAEKQKQLEQYEATISDLRGQLANMQSLYSEACEDKKQLSSSLEELDNEHQQVIDQVLKSKLKVSEELSTTKKSLVNTQTELTRNNELLTISQSKINELVRLRKEMCGQVTLIQNKYEQEKEEKNKLIMERDKIMQENNSENFDQCNELITRLKQSENDLLLRDNTILKLKSDISTSTALIGQLNSEIQNFTHKMDSTSKLEIEFTILQKKVEDQTKELDSVKDELKSSTKIIYEMKDKMTFQEEEILKYEAVLEEKNNEYVSAYERLKHQEAANQNMLRDFESERREISLKLKNAEDKLKQMDEMSKKMDAIPKESTNSLQLTIIQQLLKTCNVQKMEDLPSATSELASEIALLRCERDKLAEDLAVATQDLRDNQELLEAQEIEKGEIERECEDLRDQIEELQCGERQTPEGSVTPRSLPTIEEEEDTTVTQTDGTDNKRGNERLNNDGCGNGEGEDKFELIERVEQLNSQVNALTEARQNLELEISSLRDEKANLEQGLVQANVQLGNLANLEVEAVSLRNENESLIGQLNETNVQLQSCSQLKDEKENLVLKVQELTDEMGKINLDSSRMYSDEVENALQDQICVQNTQLIDKTKEINRLNKILKERTHASPLFFEPESKLALLQADLDAARGVLVYKDDQIDELKLGVKQIGLLFDIQNKDLRQTYVAIKQEAESLKSQINSLRRQLDRRENRDENAGEEGGELKDLLPIKIRELDVAQELIQILKDQIDNLKKSDSERSQQRENALELKIEELKDQLIDEKVIESRLGPIMDKWNSDRRNSIKLDEEIGEINQIKQAALAKKEAEMLENQNVIIELKNKLEKVTKEMLEEESRLKEFKESLVREKEEISRELQLIKEENLKIKKDLEQVCTEKQKIQEETQELIVAKNNIESERNTLLKEIELVKESESSSRGDYESLSQQLSTLQQERQQMISMSSQKHQESVSYYNEIQRLSQIIQLNAQQSAASNESWKSQLNAKNEELLSMQTEVKLLNAKLTELHGQVGRIKEVEHLQSSSKNEMKLLQEELRNVNDELTRQQELSKSILSERDHLRKANATFNSQYEEKTRELSELQEKERYLSQECLRLKQHLMEVEQTYTNEAVQSEQREASLRQSIAKLHEKMSSHSNLYSTTKEKSTAQLESLQEKLRDAIFQKDEALQKLQVSEEASMQHQEGLSRLQQVLQDFQKAQVRDIALATEREKRRYEEERMRNRELELEMRKLQEKLSEMEADLLSTKSMREELQAKEDTLFALKSQVQAVQLAARKSQEQVAVLQSNSEAKVDKHLLRNLVVGYFATNSDKRQEVLRIVAQVLDFSAEERARTGLDMQHGTWLSSIANFLAPPPSNIRIASKVDLLDHTSLSQAFIRFLEEESAPRHHPILPAVEMAEEAQQKAQKKAQAKAGFNTNPLYNNSELNSASIATSPFIASSMPTSLSTLQPVTASATPEVNIKDGALLEPITVAPPISSQPSQPNPLLFAPNANSLSSTISPLSHGGVYTTDEVSQPKFLSNLLNSGENTNEQSSNS